MSGVRVARCFPLLCLQRPPRDTFVHDRSQRRNLFFIRHRAHIHQVCRRLFIRQSGDHGLETLQRCSYLHWVHVQGEPKFGPESLHHNRASSGPKIQRMACRGEETMTKNEWGCDVFKKNVWKHLLTRISFFLFCRLPTEQCYSCEPPWAF